jgi:hypothetical protein
MTLCTSAAPIMDLVRITYMRARPGEGVKDLAEATKPLSAFGTEAQAAMQTTANADSRYRMKLLSV